MQYISPTTHAIPESPDKTDEIIIERYRIILTFVKIPKTDLSPFTTTVDLNRNFFKLKKSYALTFPFSSERKFIHFLSLEKKLDGGCFNHAIELFGDLNHYTHTKL